MASMTERGGWPGVVFGCVFALSSSCGSDTSSLFSDEGGGADGEDGGQGGSGDAGKSGGQVAGGLNVGGTLAGADAGGQGGVSTPGAGGDAGGGGQIAAPGCDDGDACTHDTRTHSGQCVHTPRPCIPSHPCESAACDPATGACLFGTEPDGTECDDQRSCNVMDVCVSGVCQGSTPEVVLRETTAHVIPDGPTPCNNVDEELTLTFDSSAPLTVANVTVEINLYHTYISELTFLLRHEPSGRTATLFSMPPTQRVDADGVYTFVDGGAPYPLDISFTRWVPGSYAPVSSLAGVFAGVPMAGTWTLTASDDCDGEEGTLRSVTIRLQPEVCQ